MQFLLWTIALILSAAAGYWVYRADKKRSTPYPWLTALLRSVVVFLTLLLILAPVITISNTETRKPVILFLQDNSASIGTALGSDSGNYKTGTHKFLQTLSGNYKVVTRTLQGTTSPDSLFNYQLQSTDISAALTDLQEYCNTQHVGAIVLATDGRYNLGSNPLYQQLSIQCPLYTVGIGDSTTQKDIRITRVYANKTASLNSSFEIQADVVATLCTGYNNSIRLTENGNVLATTPIAINNPRFDRSVSFTIKAGTAGLHHYIIEIPQADGETNTTNNRKDVFIEVVDEKKNILIAAAAPHPDVNAIREALSEVDAYNVTVRMASELPAFDNYSVIIFHQIPSLLYNIQRDILIAKKPTWYILGAQTNVVGIQALQKPVNLSINPAVLRDIYPVYNLSFNSFSVPQGLQALIDKMPPLSVPSGGIQALPDADVLFRQRDAEQIPLWALQHGNISTAVTTGEGIWRWRLYEYKNFNTHNSIDECIRQTVAFLAANSNEKPFYVSIPKYVWSDQEAVVLNAYLLNATNQQVNSADVQLLISDNNKKHTYSFERSGNNYKLNTGSWPAGNYTYQARTTYNGHTYSAAGNFVVEHTPLEQMESGADFGMLYNLAKKHNGHFVPATGMQTLTDTIMNNANIKPVIQTNVQAVPLVDWKWYFLLILMFAVAEWLLRKYWLAQ